MGKMSNGILGQTTGKVGNVVGSTWKGINTVRVHQPNVLNPRTAGQVSARTSMSGVSKLGSVLLSTIVTPLWNRFAKKASGYNDFCKANINLFVDGVLSGFSQFAISFGKMVAPILQSVDVTGVNCVISFGSVDNDAYALPTDEVYVVVLDNINGKVLYAGKLASNRNTVEDSDITITLSSAPTGATHVYAAFRRVDGTIVSNTGYITEA